MMKLKRILKKLAFVGIFIPIFIIGSFITLFTYPVMAVLAFFGWLLLNWDFYKATDFMFSVMLFFVMLPDRIIKLD